MEKALYQMQYIIIIIIIKYFDLNCLKIHISFEWIMIQNKVPYLI